ncbi:MAG: hypothetical protein C0436_01730 [Alphaproteobacteria bacterium]|nr:hypothetical protein [Alphaproteobacteria bacterium]
MRFLIIATALCLATPALARDTYTVGWVEEVILQDVGLKVKAKLDTGAKTSSLDADIIDIAKSNKTQKKRPGEKVVFTVQADEKSEKKTFEREIVRYVRIKKKGGGYIRRPVIEMTFCVGGRLITEEVNLANRENFIYPVLIGRNMMQHANLVIDASRTLISKPTCKPQAKKD